MAGAVGGAGLNPRIDGGVDADVLDPDGLGDSPFDFDGPTPGSIGQSTEQVVGEARVIDVRGSPLALRETPAFARAVPPHVMLQAVIDGRPVYDDGRGGQTMLRPGALIIRRADEAAVIRAERFARVVTVTLAQHLLAPRFATAPALGAGVVQTDNALPQRLLYSFIVGLADDVGSPWLNPKTTIVDGLGGLVSMIMAQAPQPAAELSELAAERVGKILRHLRRNFANPHLTPAMMAEDLNISVRYAHKLMQLTGRSFREELVALRLEAARQAFAANRRPRQTIADIAISVGFNDLSQFNRHFRAAFGMTPKAARKLDEANGYASAAFDDDHRPASASIEIAGPSPRELVIAGARPRPLSMATGPG